MQLIREIDKNKDRLSEFLITKIITMAFNEADAMRLFSKQNFQRSRGFGKGSASHWGRSQSIPVNPGGLDKQTNKQNFIATHII